MIRTTDRMIKDFDCFLYICPFCESEDVQMSCCKEIMSFKGICTACGASGPSVQAHSLLLDLEKLEHPKDIHPLVKLDLDLRRECMLIDIMQKAVSAWNKSTT